MQGHMITERNIWLDQFDSLNEALVYAQQNTDRRSSDQERDSKWAGTHNLDSAVKLGVDGWHDIRPDVDAMFSKMEEQINMALGDVFETRFDYGGDSVDIDRFMMGDPECMIDYVTTPAGRMGRVVRVLVNGSASASVSAERIMQRGVLATALVDVLAKLGVGVEVWLESATDDHGKSKHSQLIKLHSSEERLDIDNLMYALAHPSMLRRIGFSILERTGWANAKKIAQVGAGYGQPHDCLMKDYIQADIVIDKLQNATGDPVADGVAYIMSTVKGLDLL